MDGFPKPETRWVCSDGLHFADQSRADRHQDHIDRVAQANDVLNAGGSVLDALRVAGYSLCDHEYVEVLSRVNAVDRLPSGTMSHLIPLRIVSGFGVLCLRNEPTSTSTVELTPRDLAWHIREEKA